MSAAQPLTGLELIDCARATGNRGLEAAARNCGFGEDIVTFEQELRQAAEAMGIHIQGFSDLVATEQKQEEGIEFAPESPDDL